MLHTGWPTRNEVTVPPTLHTLHYTNPYTNNINKQHPSKQMNRVIIHAREPKNALKQMQIEVGQEKTEEIYERNLFQLLSQCTAFSTIIVTPDSPEYFQEHFPDIEVRQVIEKTFGDQLKTAIAVELDTFGKVILLADNSPLIDIPTVEHAFILLDIHDMVIGPSNNGKHYLVGFTELKQLDLIPSKDNELEVYAQLTGEELEPHQSLMDANDYNFFTQSDLI